MTKGRTVPPLPEHTFKDSGITIQIRKLSPLTVDDLSKTIRKAKPEPQPPLQPVDYGDGKQVMEPNRTHPAYQAALQEYLDWFNTEVGERLMQLVTTRAIVCDVDTEAVAAFRADMEALGIEVEGDDKDVYVRHICIQSTEDLNELRDAVTRRSQPTEAAIADNVTAFPGNVPGA